MLAIAILGIISVFSIGMNKMDKVYEEANQCNVNVLPSIIILGDLQQALYRMRIVALQHISSDNDKTKKELEEKFAEYKHDFEKALIGYAPLVADVKDKALLETEKEYFAKYVTIVQEAFRLSREGKMEEIKK